MKFIGQYIQQFIARFRNDVYLEDISTGTIASGGNLGLDSNNKIVKNTVSGGGGGTASDITVADESSDTTCFPTFVTAATGDLPLKTGSNLTFNSSIGKLEASILSATSNVTAPDGFLTNIENNDTSSELSFTKLRNGGTIVDGDTIGSIDFRGYNDASTQELISFAGVIAKVSDVTDGQEAGSLEFQVAEFDGTKTTGLKLEGDTNANGEVDVTIGAGAASTTTVAGTLTMGSTSTLNNSGVLQVAAQPNITTLAGVFTGSANQLITDDGDGTVSSESGLIYDSSAYKLQLNAPVNGFPNLELLTDDDGANGSQMAFLLETQSLANTDKLGKIFWSGGTDASSDMKSYGEINCFTSDITSGSEAGRMDLMVVTDGTLGAYGLRIQGSDTAGVVNATIGGGTTSTTTVSGDLQVNGNDIKDDDGTTCITFDSSGNTAIAGTLAVADIDVTSTAGQSLTITAGSFDNPVKIIGGDSKVFTRYLDTDTAGTNTIAVGALGDDSYFRNDEGSFKFYVANDATVGAELTQAGNLTIAGDLKVTGNVIKDDDGFACITFDSSGNTIIGTLDGNNGGDLIVNRILVKDTDESPSAQVVLVDNDDNNIAQLARIGSGANAHRGQLVLRDNATAKVQIKASGSSYINASSAKLGIGNNSPTKELDVTGDTNISGDLIVGGDVKITGNLKALGDVKILPSDFIADDVGRPLMIDDTGSDRFLESHSTAKMYASINVPVGTKATQVIIYGSGTSAVTVYEADVTSKSVTSKGTGNIGTLLNFTDITGDASNYVLIELDQTSSEEVYGGKLTIA